MFISHPVLFLADVVFHPGTHFGAYVVQTMSVK
jgi:hypothetical protein